MSDATRLLESMGRGQTEASERLLPLVYEELRKLAAVRMAAEAPGQTLQPTALVHEAWLRLAGSQNQCWENRGHFFAAAAEAMRRVLIDRARRRNAAVRGGGRERVDLEAIDLPAEANEHALLWVNDALEGLRHDDPAAAQLVQLRFFAGMKVEEAAAAMGITDRTARRYWRFARAWLLERLDGPGE